MPMDPVIALMEEIRVTDEHLMAVCRQEEPSYNPEQADRVNALLARLKSLYAELFETVPMSAPGASELLRVVIQRLSPAQARHGTHLGQIADRLAEGRRRHTDLVWLRALAGSLMTGPDSNPRLAALIANAIRGAARPVLVYRAVGSGRPAEDRRDLAIGPR